MGINLSFSKRSLGEYLSLVAGVATIACLALYYPYEASLNALDMAVVGYLVAILVCNLAYFVIEVKTRFDLMGVVELVSVALSALCLTEYLHSDINNLADLLNGVTIFSGGSGSADTIFTIIGCMAALGVIQIIVCFLPKKSKTAAAKAAAGDEA